MKRFEMIRRKVWDAIGVFLRPTIRRSWPDLYVTCTDHDQLRAENHLFRQEIAYFKQVNGALQARTFVAESTQVRESIRLKEAFASMERAIHTRAAEMAKDITAVQIQKIDALIDANKRLENASQEDALTNICNRRGLEERFCVVHNTLVHALRADDEHHQKQPIFSAMAIDVDFFKRINDVYGHDTGDQILIRVAKLIVTQAGGRESDIVSRLGGDEFFVVFPQADVRFAFTKAAELLYAIQTTPLHTKEVLTVSIGVAEIKIQDHKQSSTETLNWLYAMADRALYQSKREGRNRVSRYSADLESGSLAD